MIRKDLNPTIKKISDRICTAKIKLKEHNLVFISAYAHTLEKSEKEPNLREEFYEALESIIEKTAKRDLLVIRVATIWQFSSNLTDLTWNCRKYLL